MPRIPYQNLPDDDVTEAVRARRGGEITPLDKLLAHSIHLLAGWNSLLGAVRGELSIGQHVIELIALRVAVINGAGYEWAAHLPLGTRSGLAEEVISALLERSPRGFASPEIESVVRATDELTVDARLSGATFEQLRHCFDERGLVEVIAVIATYNMVSRVLVGLDLTERDRSAGNGSS